jgi:hypothetical protein
MSCRCATAAQRAAERWRGRTSLARCVPGSSPRGLHKALIPRCESSGSSDLHHADGLGAVSIHDSHAGGTRPGALAIELGHDSPEKFGDSLGFCVVEYLRTHLSSRDMRMKEVSFCPRASCSPDRSGRPWCSLDFCVRTMLTVQIVAYLTCSNFAQWLSYPIGARPSLPCRGDDDSYRGQL